jgi:hypothetical protein
MPIILNPRHRSVFLVGVGDSFLDNEIVSTAFWLSVGFCCQVKLAVRLPYSGGLVAHVFYGEFDPGSGRTLAACLTHASRTMKLELALVEEWRTGE